MSAWNDYSDADEQTSGDVIPKGTLAKVHLKIRPGGYDDSSQGWTGGYATRSENTGAIYLDGEFTVIGGKYSKRKVWTLIGLHSPKGDKWAQMGRTMIRAILESSRGIRPDDASEAAMKERRISGFGDLDGREFVVKIGVDENPGYEPKNVIQAIIPATHKDYAALMAGQEVAMGAPAPSAPTQPASSTPAWAQ